MAWPVTRLDTFKPNSAAWNELVNALSVWGGNTNAGGYNLSNVGTITAASITSVNSPLLVTQPAAVALANGANQNVSVANSYIRISGPTLAFSIGGFAAGVDGQLLRIRNSTGQTMTLNHADAGSTAANRIFCFTGANVVVAGAAGSVVDFIYNQSQWDLIQHNP